MLGRLGTSGGAQVVLPGEQLFRAAEDGETLAWRP